MQKGIDGGLIGERLRLGEIAEEIDLRRATVFRDWDYAAGGAVQRLRARFEPMSEAGGTLTGFGGLLTLLQDGRGVADEAAAALDRHMDFIRLSSDWMWETDAALNLRLVTQRVVGALGMVPQQLIGRYLLELVASDALRGVTGETVTDETGLYRFADLAPASYQISASAQGLQRNSAGLGLVPKWSGP